MTLDMLRVALVRLLGFVIALFVVIPVSIIALFKGTIKNMFFHNVRKKRPDEFDHFGAHRYLDLPKGKIRIHMVDTGSDGDSKPLMLFIHGFPDFWYSYRHQIKYFSSRFRCVSIDNRGYNESDKPKNIQDYDIDNLASDVKEVIEILGHKKCILVGHDWGGAIGYQVCHRYPEMVSFYFALNIPNGMAFMEALKNTWSQRLASWYMLYFQCPIIPEIMINSFDMKNWDTIFQDIPYSTVEERQKDLDAYKYVFSQPNSLTGPLNYYRCFIQYYKRDFNDKERIKVPVCSIYGNGDKYLKRDAFVGSAKYVEDFTLKELQGISHWVHMHAKDDVNRIMDEYIELKKDLIYK